MKYYERIRRRIRELTSCGRLFLSFLHYVAPCKWHILLISIFMWSSAAVGMVLPLVARFLVDVVVPQQKWPWFWLIVVAYAAVSLLLQLVNLVQGYLSLKMRTRVHAAVSLHFYDHLLHLPYKIIRRQSAGSQLFRTTDDITAVVGVLNTFFTSVTTNLLSLLVAVSLMIKLNWGVALIFVATVPAAFLCRLYVSLKTRPVVLERRDCREAISSHLGDSYTAIKEIKVSGMEHAEVDRYRKLLQQGIAYEFRLWKLDLILSKVQAFFESGVASLLQWWIWFLVMKQVSTIGTAMAMSWYFSRIMGPFMVLAGSIQSIIRAMAPGERVLEVFACEREDSDAHTEEDLQNPIKKIVLSDVSFAYDDRNTVLASVSLEMSPGRLHFLLGPSGSGKTTLIHLLCALYTGYRGEIRINGKRLEGISRRSLRKEIRLLEQDPWIFAATVRDNIGYGSSIISQTEVERAARDAGIHDRICQLPEGYDTAIQPGTSDLSGGERQRLALARLLASHASVLLLDEPFSNLDSENEKQIVRTLRESYVNKIILVITHRVEYIEETDRVFCLGGVPDSIDMGVVVIGPRSAAVLSSPVRGSSSPHSYRPEPTVTGTRRSI